MFSSRSRLGDLEMKKMKAIEWVAVKISSPK